VVFLYFIGCNGCKKAAETKKIVIRAAHGNAPDYPYHLALQYFGKKLQEKISQPIDFKIYPSGQLGKVREVIEGLQMGTVEMTVGTADRLSNFVTEVNVLNLPFIFRDLQHAYEVGDGPIGDELARYLEKRAGLKVLGWGSAGTRSVFTLIRPIYNPEDLKGLRIRVIPDKMNIDVFNLLGADAVPISYDELYAALQQGVVNSGENDPISIVQQKFYEVCQYYSLTEHFNTGCARPLLMSLKFFNKQSPDVQKAILAAGKETIVYERALFEEKSKEAMTELEKRGVKINKVPDTTKEALRAKVKPVWDEFTSRSAVNKRLLDAILATQ